MGEKMFMNVCNRPRNNILRTLLTIEAHCTIHGLFSGSWLDFHRLIGPFVFHVLFEGLKLA